jgi:gamma-glutamylcyclotransferase (GGCT)/AIG2-like uncharacterized protein YtfP
MGRGPEFIAVYGTLIPDQGRLDRLDLGRGLRPVGPCRIPGRLLTNGRFPCLVPGFGLVNGYLLRIIGRAVLPKLDMYEGYAPRAPQRSEFIRERLRLHDPNLDAWVYRYTGIMGHLTPIPEGCWKTWVAGLPGGSPSPAGHVGRYPTRRRPATEASASV